MKIAIVGIGRVGALTAYTLVVQGLGSELVLIGHSLERAEAEAADLRHAASLTMHRQEVRAGTIADAEGAGLVILAAARPPAGPVKSRLDYLSANVPLFADLVPRLAKVCPAAVFLVVTNPVDVMTYLTLQLSGLPPSRVIGTGALVDCARVRTLLAGQYQAHPDDIRAYIVGEHGDSQVPTASAANLGGQRLLGEAAVWEACRKAVAEGHEIFRRKGYTNYAIASAVAMITSAICGDTRQTVPVSVLVDDFLGEREVCVSLPAVLGRTGVLRVLHPELNQAETEAFRKSVALVRQANRQAMELAGKGRQQT